MTLTTRTAQIIIFTCFMFLLTSCGMTPAERAKQKEIATNKAKQVKINQAQAFFSSINSTMEWKKGARIPPTHKRYNYERYGKKQIVIHKDYLWERGIGNRQWNDAVANCENAVIAGLPNWRLPTRNELLSWKWNLYSKNKSSGSAWSSESTTYRQRYGDRELYPAAYLYTSHSYFKKQTSFEIDKSRQSNEYGVRCVHQRGDAFNSSIAETAQGILNLKENSSNQVHVRYPKSIDSKIKIYERQKKGEFETQKSYEKRVTKLQADIEVYNNKLKKKFFSEWGAAKDKETRLLAEKKTKLLKQKEKNKLLSLKEAFHVLYGAPKLSSVQYNADLSQFNIVVGSQYGNFKQSVNIPLSVKYAPKFKKLITAKSFSPTVEFVIKNGEFIIQGIKEIQDPALVVERDEFNKAKHSIRKLNAFINKYPNSKYVAKARKQIKNLQYIAEQKRLAAIELAKDNADGEIVGSKNIEGAKFIAGRIWQDQSVNSKFNYKFSRAKQYCKELNHLGIKGWRLPSKSDYLSLGKDFNNFTYVANNPGYVTPYFTRDENCSRGGLFAVSKGDCVVTAHPTISEASKIRSDNSLRCVLSSYKYNINAKEQEQNYISQNTLDGYINAFSAAGNDEYIRKAFSLAQTSDDKVKIEMALIKYFGLNDVFSLKGSLVTKDGSEANRDEIDASLLLTMIASSGNAEMQYNVMPNINSTVPLKHGSYRIKVKVKLELNYVQTMKKALFGLDFSTFDTRVKEREFYVTVTPDNKWKTDGTIDFGSIVQGSESAVFVFKMSSNLQSIKPSFALMSIEKI
ncbi:hypothetical protein [Colwellia sp. BRX8-9]|uniref:hypothetical protein n=1 Tax=Colwellia sp. BRX8-9 TaxID=2759831 RepID=UPI0015F5C287|nr:hypothetical protein [Colwellia sp. BRX8-9]MBA6348103.1 hypothetical protein [Colwellia sp. BRX8-9]